MWWMVMSFIPVCRRSWWYPGLVPWSAPIAFPLPMLVTLVVPLMSTLSMLFMFMIVIFVLVFPWYIFTIFHQISRFFGITTQFYWTDDRFKLWVTVSRIFIAWRVWHTWRRGMAASLLFVMALCIQARRAQTLFWLFGWGKITSSTIPLQ